MTIQLLEYQIVLILMLSSYRSCFVTVPIFALNNKSEGYFICIFPSSAGSGTSGSSSFVLGSLQLIAGMLKGQVMSLHS